MQYSVGLNLRGAASQVIEIYIAELLRLFPLQTLAKRKIFFMHQ